MTSWPARSGARSTIRSEHVVIIGAGLMGAAIGRELRRRRPELAVTLLERAIPGAEASSAAAGILGAQAEPDGPGPLLDLALASRALWPDFAAAVTREAGLEVGYRACGLIEVGFSPADLDRLDHWARWMGDAGLGCERLDGAQVRRRLPAASAAVRGGVWLRDEGAVEPRSLVPAVLAAAQAAGVVVVSGAVVIGLASDRGRVRGVDLVRAGGERDTLAADHVVVAAGAWTDLVPGLPACRTPVTPVRGQLARLQPTGPVALPCVLKAGTAYLVPRADGTVVVGATTEAVGFERGVTVNGLALLLAGAVRLLPALADAAVLEHWYGLRPHAGDGLPLLGPHADLAGLHLASGLYRNGILLAPVVAAIVAAGVLGEAPPLSGSAWLPEPYRKNTA